MSKKDKKDKKKKPDQETKESSLEETKKEVSENEEEKKELSLEEKFELLKKENAELKEKLLRRAAEFENFRKRSFVEKADWIKNANKRLILEICDVVDNFERALHPDTENNREAFEKGIGLIFDQLNDLIKKEGVKKIEAENKEFDPQLHEALAHIPSDKKENIVTAVIRNGYMMNEKVIRPARVAVSNGEKLNDKKKDK